MRHSKYHKSLVSLVRVVLLLVTYHLSLITASAQVGEYRNSFAVGVNGGYLLSKVSFVPEVPQDYSDGLTGGLTLRYTSEKYFNSICALTAEVNYSQMGWKESILTINDEPVINRATGLAEEYRRKITYIQVPLLARLGWGRERKGLQAFIQLGPQLGFYLDESTEANFDLDYPEIYERASHISGPTVGDAVFSNMYHMPVENKFDYGITGGAGIEFSHPKIGHILLEGRYYFGLANIYGNTKKDFFAKSNHNTIIIKMSYLFDVFKTKNPKIK